VATVRSTSWGRRAAAVAGSLALLVPISLSTGSSASAEALYAEQEGHNGVNTFTNYHNASGMGPRINPGQWVNVSCKVYDPYIQSVNPDGYWYRIADSPWNDQYYSPANTFMNGDPWGGPYTHNTDFNVPDCGSAPPPPQQPPPPSPVATLAQGPAASVGYWYAITLDHFAANSGVTVSCSDSKDAGFRSFTLNTDGNGHGFTQSQCRSNDGPDHWYIANGVQSNHVSWGPRYVPPPVPPVVQNNPPPPPTSTSNLPPPPSPTQRATGDPCITVYGSGVQTTHNIFGGSETDYDRTASLFQQCEGFGSPDDREYSPEMKCALIAATGIVMGYPANVTTKDACDALGFADAVANGGWVSAAGGWACDLLSEAFAGRISVLAAGASSELGLRAALAVGKVTYRGLYAALRLTCSAVFDGGGYTFGYNLEAHHETAVALDIITKGECLRMRRVLGYISWSAAPC
jgi:hypothetical protein